MARRATQSDGIAIALERNGEFVCCARAGSTAPNLGATVDRDAGLSGECIRTATTLICRDAETDLRVDAAVCRRLGVRSVIAVPLLCDTRTIGIVEAFSACPHDSSRDAVRVLERLSEAVIAAVAREYTSSPTAGAVDDHDGQDVAPPRQDDAELITANTEPQVTGRADLADVQREPPLEFMPDPPLRYLESLAGESRMPWRNSARRFSTWARQQLLLGILLLALAAVVGGLAALHGFSSGKRSQAGSPLAPLNHNEGLRAGAEAGDSTAQYRLAMDIENGRTPARQPGEFFDWLLRSAYLGNTDAQYELGNVLAQGRSVPQDLVGAYTWYLVAGLSGKAEGQAAAQALVSRLSAANIAEVRFHVGQMYALGKALPRDYVNAYSWLTLAEAAGQSDATREKFNVAAHLNLQQRAQAARRASMWLARHSSAQRVPTTVPVAK